MLLAFLASPATGLIHVLNIQAAAAATIDGSSNNTKKVATESNDSA
jgi:hypothetical protein